MNCTLVLIEDPADGLQYSWARLGPRTRTVVVPRNQRNVSGARTTCWCECRYNLLRDHGQGPPALRGNLKIGAMLGGRESTRGRASGTWTQSRETAVALWPILWSIVAQLKGQSGQDQSRHSRQAAKPMDDRFHEAGVRWQSEEQKRSATELTHQQPGQDSIAPVLGTIHTSQSELTSQTPSRIFHPA